QVFTDAAYSKGGAMPEDGIQLKFTADFRIDSDWHWIQFFSFQLYDDKGKWIDNSEYKPPLSFGVRKEGVAVWHKYGYTYLDCPRLPQTIKNHPLQVYYDVRNYFTIRAVHELSIFDKPTERNANPKFFAKVEFKGETYLVHR